MNEDSYETDFDVSMQRLLREHHSVFWSQDADIEASHEFSNCMVKKFTQIKQDIYVKSLLSTDTVNQNIGRTIFLLF